MGKLTVYKEVKYYGNTNGRNYYLSKLDLEQTQKAISRHSNNYSWKKWSRELYVMGQVDESFVNIGTSLSNKKEMFPADPEHNRIDGIVQISEKQFKELLQHIENKQETRYFIEA